MVKQKGKLACFFTLLLGVVCCMNARAVNNPISYNTEINDCDVIKYNGEYYMQGNWLKGDMLRSRDLESWGERQHVFSWNNTWHTQVNQTDPDYDIHGTHIRYHNGTFHLYAHLDVQDGITHATSSSIWGPYTEPVNSPFAHWIDADTFLDENGSLYFYSTRIVSGKERNYACTMSGPGALSSSYMLQIDPSGGWEGSSNINEGSKVFKYRGRYYMLYNAYPTSDPNYSIGCVEASGPTSFSNSGKYSAPVCTRYTPPGHDEIAYIGQPWVVEGLNGFERWLGYFGQTASEGRTQRIDRMHFFDRTLFVDGPTDRWTPGYHPGPAKPQMMNIFAIADGPMPSWDWDLALPGSGAWGVLNEETYQSSQSCFTFNVVNREAATDYLIEANVRMTAAQDGEDKAGVVAYYADANNWVIVGLDRSLNYGADNWYCHVKENGVDTVYAGGYNGSVDYSAYHKIRVTKNGGRFDIRIDDMIPPGHTTITTGLTGTGRPGLFSNNAPAVYDGVIYTIGWDEFDGGIGAWGNNINGVPQAGTWTVAGNGISSSGGYTFKGDLMPEYEFSAQVYKTAGDGTVGILSAAIDMNNYVLAAINTSTDQLELTVVKDGAVHGFQSASVGNADNYNIRTVKLADKIIVFVDGQQMIDYVVSFGPSQVGLYAGVPARFNGILTYRTEPVADIVPWVTTDIGAVGFAGIADYHDDALFLTGSGADIWHLNDEFTFTHIDDTGDFEISARVVNVDDSDWWAKSALMFRNDLADNSGMVMLCATPGGHAQLIWRDAPGYGTGIVEASGLSYPFWLKLKRVGTTFSGYHSTDGQNWTPIGNVTPPLNASGKLGFGACSHNNDRITTSVMDHIGVTL